MAIYCAVKLLLQGILKLLVNILNIKSTVFEYPKQNYGHIIKQKNYGIGKVEQGVRD